MTNQDTKRRFILGVSEDVVQRPKPPEWDSPSEYMVRVYFVTARAVGSTRFWPDFVHDFDFENSNSRLKSPKDRAYRLCERIEKEWLEEDGTVSEHRFINNPHWVENTRLNPLQELELYGAEDEYNQALQEGYRI